MSQQVITTWEMFIRNLDSTMKQKNSPRRHCSSTKRFSVRFMLMSREVITTWEMFLLLLNKTTGVIMTEKSLNCATKQGGKIVHPQVASSCRDLRIVDKCLRLRNQTEIKDCISIYSKREREQSLICLGEGLDSVRSEY